MQEEHNRCFEEAKLVLKQNGRPDGIVAGYRYRDNIWGRDGFITSLGMSSSEDPKLIDLARLTINTLSMHQHTDGQIPDKIRTDKSKVCFGKAGSVDPSLWYPIAVLNYYKNTGEKEFLEKHKERILDAMRWAESLDQNKDHMIEANPGSDWFDLYRRSGRVLYTEILYYGALKATNNIFNELGEHIRFSGERLSDYADNVKQNIQWFFWPESEYSDVIKKKYNYSWISDDFNAALTKKKELDQRGESHFLNTVNFSSADNRFVTLGNCLAILFGITDKKQEDSILKYMEQAEIGKPYPAKCLNPPITEKDPEYRSVYPDASLRYTREPELHKKRMTPGNYHNGGIWPWIGSFYVLALKKGGKKYEEAFLDLTELNSLDNYSFYEWINSKGDLKGDKGTKWQSWSAGMYIMLCRIDEGADTVFNDF